MANCNLQHVKGLYIYLEEFRRQKLKMRRIYNHGRPKKMKNDETSQVISFHKSRPSEVIISANQLAVIHGFKSMKKESSFLVVLLLLLLLLAIERPHFQQIPHYYVICHMSHVTRYSQ